MTELTEMAIEVKQGKGDLDGLLLRWAEKIKLEGMVYNKTIRREDANDLKQEILLNIFERLQEYNPERAEFETWAFNRARQVTRSYIRKEIKNQSPVIRKGYKDRPTMRGVITGFPEGYDAIEAHNSIDAELMEREVDELMTDLETAIDFSNMREDNIIPTKTTLRLLNDELDINEIAELTESKKSKIQCNIGRIRNAYNLLEEAKNLI